MCGVLFGEVKIGEADYTVIWETMLFMSNILCQISWKGLLMPTAFLRLFVVGKCKKHSPQYFFRYDKTLNLHQIWWLMLEKLIQECQNWSPNSMVHYAHIQYDRISIIELVQDLRVMNVLAIFQNDPWQFMDVRALTVNFLVRSCKMQKKNCQIFFADYEKPEIYID